MQPKETTGRVVCSTELNVLSTNPADQEPFENTPFNQGLSSYADPGTLGLGDDVLTSTNILRRLQLFLAKLWGATGVTFHDVFWIYQRFPSGLIRRKGNTSAKGFASVDPHSAGGVLAEHPLMQPTEETHTDHEEHLQDTPHQRLAELLKHSYKYALRFPTVISNAAKRSSSPKSLPGATPLNGHRFWGVLIGINGYKDSLFGCISDVQTMEDWMRDTLGVPKTQIKRLLGERSDTSSEHIPADALRPTRANILNTFHGLATNSEIKKGDSIIIFFSGHGSSYQCPDCRRTIFGETESSSKMSSAPHSVAETESHKNRCPIEAICPIDRDSLAHIPDISDREMNNILAKIHQTTGAYITVILDCCHSGGATKAPQEGAARATRPLLGYETFVRMLDCAKESMEDWSGYRDEWEKTWLPDMGSHVVLAACRDYQLAKETEQDGHGYRGVFTSALVKTLTSGVLNEGSTYVDLIDALPKWDSQTPVVSGNRKKERLWC